MIYLDYAASTPADPAVAAAFCKAQAEFPANPNASHPMGRAARQALAKTTESIAALLDVGPSQVVFTSGSSESNNLALQGTVRGTGLDRVITTPLEHPSVNRCLEALERQGCRVEAVNLRPDGTVDLGHLRQLLQGGPALVTVSSVDSELGIVQPIGDIGRIVAEFPDSRLHVDATQAVGKTKLVLDGADTVSLSPHKFGGLTGVGLLLKRGRVKLEPLIYGADSVRAGTPALALAVSAETALALALEYQTQRLEAVTKWNRQLRQALSQYPAVQFNSPEAAVPHMLNLSVQGVKGTVFQRALGEYGVCVSVRSACATDGAPSRPVLALTGDARRALSSWRISLSHQTTQDEIDRFLTIFDRCYRQLVR